MPNTQKGLQQLNEYPSHKGGDTCSWGGYVWEYCPGHHLQNQWGWVAQHRLVAETALGRPLVLSSDPRTAETVHHKNEVRHDNRPDNLEVLTTYAHRKFHGRLRADRQLARLNPELVASALEGRTIREAAAFLGTTHMTLRRRFPEVVAPRKRRSPADPTDPQWADRIRPYAADKYWTLQQTAKAVGLGALSVRRICAANGIPWVANKDEGRTGRPKKASPLG